MTLHKKKEKEVTDMKTNERWNERNVVLSVRCNLCNKVYAVYVTEEDYEEFCSPDRRIVQEIFPYLSASERELLISRTCDDCWNKMFSCNEEDDDEEFECEEYYKADGYISCEELNEQW